MRLLPRCWVQYQPTKSTACLSPEITDSKEKFGGKNSFKIAAKYRVPRNVQQKMWSCLLEIHEILLKEFSKPEKEKRGSVLPCCWVEKDAQYCEHANRNLPIN